jgi:hypothetical protein
MIRAKDAFAYLRNSPHQFTISELILHRKQVGTNPDLTEDQVDEDQPKKKKIAVIDDDGFEVVQKKK